MTNKSIRILFVGTVEISKVVLEYLARRGEYIVGVCTSQDSRINSDYVDLEPICLKYKIPLIKIADINHHEVVSWIKKSNPDLIICIGWSRLLGGEVLKIPSLGVIGYHPAALPLNRGRHPLIWALVLGLKKTASTFFFIKEGVDDGDIISQVEVDIEFEDNARSLYEKMKSTALKQLEIMLPKIHLGDFNQAKQVTHQANTWRKRSKNDGIIDWRMSANSIYNLVRGLSKPYVGAEFMYKGVMHKLWSASIIYDCPDNFEPGKVILNSNNNLVVKCGHDAICLLHVDPTIVVPIGEYL